MSPDEEAEQAILLNDQLVDDVITFIEEGIRLGRTPQESIDRCREMLELSRQLRGAMLQ